MNVHYVVCCMINLLGFKTIVFYHDKTNDFLTYIGEKL